MSVKKDEKTGKWFYYGVIINGSKKKQYKKRGFKTKRDALTAERKFLLNYEPEREKPDHILFNDLVKEFFKYSEHRLKPSTYYTDMSNCKHWENKFSNRYLDEIDKYEYQDFIDELSKKYDVSYIKRLYGFGSKLFRWGVKRELIEKNPLTILDLPKAKERKEMSFWELSDFNKYINFEDDIMIKTIIMTLFYMGLRKGECLALQWKDIDFKSKKMNIRKSTNDQIRKKAIKTTSPKTNNSYRIITMPDILYNQLKAWYKVQSSFCYFDNQESYLFGNNEPICSVTLKNKFRQTIKELNTTLPPEEQVKQIRIHDLRHSHASYLINNMSSGFTDFDIAKRLGDTVSTLHNTYAHWFKRKDENIIDFMNRDII